MSLTVRFPLLAVCAVISFTPGAVLLLAVHRALGRAPARGGRVRAS